MYVVTCRYVHGRPAWQHRERAGSEQGLGEATGHATGFVSGCRSGLGHPRPSVLLWVYAGGSVIWSGLDAAEILSLNPFTVFVISLH